MDLWKDLPFFAILVLSGLQFISGDIYEAAKVDGANGIQCFFRITLPLILKNVLTLSIPFTLWRLTTFDIVYSMTSGGPGEDTALIAYRITTEAFNQSECRLCICTGNVTVCCDGSIQLAEYTCYEQD